MDPDFIELDEVGRTKAYYAGMNTALFGSIYGPAGKEGRNAVKGTEVKSDAARPSLTEDETDDE